MAMTMASHDGRPLLVIRPAHRQPDTAMMEPTDRSMPPMRMTMVMPQARNTFVDIWRMTLKMFVGVAKESEMIDNPMHMMHRPMRMPRLPRMILTRELSIHLLALLVMFLSMEVPLCYFVSVVAKVIMRS